MYHPIIHKDVDELLAKIAIQTWMYGAGFYSMHLWFQGTLLVYDQSSTLSSWIALCTYHLFRCLLSDRYSTLFSKVIIHFSIDLKDAYLYMPIVKQPKTFQ